jgi:multicomponent Na+:H+ antiporter subunit E
MSNLRVARDVLTPKQYMRPGVVALPLEAKTDGEITLLAGLITLTPGTLSLDVSADRKFLYVHSMYIDDPEREKERLKRRFEKRLLEMLR